MKLSHKLVLSFSCLIILIMITAGLGWNAVTNLNNEKNFLANTEDFVSDMLKSQVELLAGIINNDTKTVQLASSELNKSLNLLDTIDGMAYQEKTKNIIRTLREETKELPTLLSGLTSEIESINKANETFGEIGNEIIKELADLKAKAADQYNTTGNNDMAAHIDEFEGPFMQLRVSMANYQRNKTDIAFQRIQNSLNQLETIADKNRNDATFRNLFNISDKYVKLTQPFVDTLIKFNENVAVSRQTIRKAVATSNELSQIARDRFEAQKSETILHVSIVAVFALLFSVILTIIINRNILKQLGADPQELSDVATRVTNGDYDVNDGKSHVGVYNNILVMVEKLKETLQFSQNILASMPIPVAVFGANNKLKYANREMMGLLEISKKMEDCIGETSGSFMYRQENFNTATAKAIASKEVGKLEIEYETHKGNHINVSTIAQPIFDAQNNVSDVISVWQDITETVRQNKIIAESHQNMQNIAMELEQVANIASSASEELSAQIELSEKGATDQADRVATTATALEEMNATVLEIARNAGTTSDSASNVRSEATAGSESMQECVKAMVEVKEESLKLQSEMGVLSEQAQAINEIMNVISDIADQTNLLALNAAIEAARAGEAGRGFAVVADSVRNLAEKTMASTTDVGSAISAIQKSTSDNTKLVMDAVEKIEKVTEMVSHAGEALLGIVQLADSTADQVRAIATASEEQSATSEEITQSVDSINNIAKENANNMQEARKAVEEMVSQTHVLSQLIEQLQSQNKE